MVRYNHRKRGLVNYPRCHVIRVQRRDHLGWSEKASEKRWDLIWALENEST